MTYYDAILEILKTIEEGHLDGMNNILPTELYNEGWMLRLVLQWFSKNRKPGYQISFNKEAHWFSEGRLETIFNDENYTEADGVFGNIIIGSQGAMHKDVKTTGISDIRLENKCRQFVAIEAKMYSNISKKVTNAKEYNQIARYVACMSNVVYKSKIDINTIEDLAFYLVMPEFRITNPTIKKCIQKEDIKNNVKDRIKYYIKNHPDNSEIQYWFDNSFQSFLEKIVIKVISWEEILTYIDTTGDHESFEILNDFYSKCRYYGSLDKVNTVGLNNIPI